MTTDLDTRITTALGTIADAARADRDAILSRVLVEGHRRPTPQRVGPLRPVTLAAGGLMVAATVVGVAVVNSRDDVETPAATQPPAVSTTSTKPGVSDTVDPATSPPAVTSTAAPTTATVPGEQVYSVVAGDNLVHIANTFCVTMGDLLAANDWLDGAQHPIVVGEEVRILGGCAPGSAPTNSSVPDQTAVEPGAGTTTTPLTADEQTYTVVEGDSLMSIAQTYCVALVDLVTENQWIDGVNHPIVTGDPLRIPPYGCLPGTGTPLTTFDPTRFNPDGVESPLRYVASEGETASSLAYQLCTRVPALAAWNEWPGGLNHIFTEGELVAVPLGSCIKGSALTPAAASAAPAGPITVIGDSEASRVAVALTAKGLDVSDLSKVSTGLARPDFYDWPSNIDDLLTTIPPASTVVMVIGSNDGQALLASDPNSPSVQAETPEWFSAYMARVQTVANTIVTAGHPLIWIGVHGTEIGAFNQLMVNVSDATDYALEKVTGALYVTAWDVLRGPDGSSPSETVIDENGTAVTVLDDRFDGTLTDDAVELLTQRVETALRMRPPPEE